MNLSIESLPESVVAAYQEQANARGISLDELLREALIENAPIVQKGPVNAEQWERALDECFDSFPPGDPLPDDAFDRENIYGDEDGR